MIAALASGLVGQLEGLTTVSSTLAGASGLFKPQGSTATTNNGRAAALPTLSDQLQSLLLQQQSQASGAVRGDGISSVASVG